MLHINVCQETNLSICCVAVFLASWDSSCDYQGRDLATTDESTWAPQQLCLADAAAQSFASARTYPMACQVMQGTSAVGLEGVLKFQSEKGYVMLPKKINKTRE